MSADILMFDSTHVPVGSDQIQHLEMTRDIAQRFNHLYKPILTVPEPMIQDSENIVPGLDGRKMSKSYPIWMKVSGDNYKQDKSFGSRDAVTMDIKVGSSKTNSHDLARVSIHMQEDDAGNRTFALALDGLVVRSAVMTKDKKFYHRDPKVA